MKSLIVLFAVVMSLVAVETEEQTALVGTDAPTFRLKTMNREGRHFTALAPNFSADSSQGVILSFYANWCGPCRDELPYLQQVTDSLADTGLRMIVVSLDSVFTNENKVLLDSLGMTSPVVHDAYGIVRSRYQYSGALPYSVYIDRSGVIRGMTTGFSDEEKEKIAELVSEILE